MRQGDVKNQYISNLPYVMAVLTRKEMCMRCHTIQKCLIVKNFTESSLNQIELNIGNIVFGNDFDPRWLTIY